MNNDLRSFYAESCGNGESEAVPQIVADAITGDTSCAPAVYTPAANVGSPSTVSGERVYIIGNQVLARKSSARDDIAPWSIGVYCPVCGNVWGRVVDDSERDPGYPKWCFEQSVCLAHVQTHGTSRYIPGSIIPALERYATGWGRNFQWEDNLPKEVLLREAAMHMRWWEGRRDKQ